MASDPARLLVHHRERELVAGPRRAEDRPRVERRRERGRQSPVGGEGGGYGDIALRDFGLLLGALTLARLATVPQRQ